MNSNNNPLPTNRPYILTKRNNDAKLTLSKKLSIDTKTIVPPNNPYPISTTQKSTKHSSNPSTGATPSNGVANFRFKQYQKQANNLKLGQKNSNGQSPKNIQNITNPSTNRTKITLKKHLGRSIVAPIGNSIEAATIENWFPDPKNTARNTIPDNNLNRNIYFLNNTLSGQPISVNININNQINQISHLDTLNPNATHTTVRLKKPERSQDPAINSVDRKRVEKSPKRNSIQCRFKYMNLPIKGSLAIPQPEFMPPVVNTERVSRIKQVEKPQPIKLISTLIPTPKKCFTNSKPLINESEINFENDINFPMTPAQMLKNFSEILDDFEKGEILDYNEIYYYPVKLKRHRNSIKIDQTVAGSWYDDEKGDYNVFIGEHLAYRYEIVGSLGKGSFGQAIRCIDHKTNLQVAVKIIRSKKRFYKQALVEVKVLKFIKENDKNNESNCIKMLDYFTFRKHIVFFASFIKEK